MNATISHIEKPRHQQAAEWADQIQDHLPWLEREDRERFLEAALEALMLDRSVDRLAFELAVNHWDAEGLAEAINRELAEDADDLEILRAALEKKQEATP